MDAPVVAALAVLVLLVVYACCRPRPEGYCNGPFCSSAVSCHGCREANDTLLAGAGHSLEALASQHPAFRGHVPMLHSGQVNAYSHQASLLPVGSVKIDRPIAATIENLSRLEAEAAMGHKASWYVIRAELRPGHRRKRWAL